MGVFVSRCDASVGICLVFFPAGMGVGFFAVWRGGCAIFLVLLLAGVALVFFPFKGRWWNMHGFVARGDGRGFVAR